ncbi:unnamed protein product [Symbiodinium sp. KB8]|nr:unnamed protein product [Symbiodinium sp. KB8]
MPETPHSSSTCVRKASPTSSSSRFTDRLQSSAEAASLSAPVQLRAWLERARQEASALYTSGALNGLRSPDRGRSRRSLSPGSTLHLESGNISIAGEEVVDPRIEMFAHPRSLSPGVRDCTIRGSALGDPGMRPQRMARPSRRQQRSAEDMSAAASSGSLLDPSGAPDRSSSSFGEAFAAPRGPSSEAPGHGTEELVAEPVTRTGLQPPENLTEEACFKHEALLQSQLLTTQQQLEELQRQYLEVQQLLRERAPGADVARILTPFLKASTWTLKPADIRCTARTHHSTRAPPLTGKWRPVLGFTAASAEFSFKTSTPRDASLEQWPAQPAMTTWQDDQEEGWEVEETSWPEASCGAPGEQELVDQVVGKLLHAGMIELAELSSHFGQRFNAQVRASHLSPYAPDKRNDGSFKRWCLGTGGCSLAAADTTKQVVERGAELVTDSDPMTLDQVL